MADHEVWFTETTLDCVVPTPDTVYVFDEQISASWWKWSGLSLTNGVKLDAAIDGTRLFAGDGTSGFLNEIEAAGATTDFGANITARWTTRWHDAGDPASLKIWRSVFIVAEQLGSSLTVRWETDDGNSSSSFTGQFTAKYAYNNPPVSFSRWNNSTASVNGGAFWNEATTGVLSYSLPQEAVGRRIRLIFEDAGSYMKPRLLGYNLYYRHRLGRYPQRGR